MDRSSVLRWGVIAIAIFLFWTYAMPRITGSGDTPKSAALPAEKYVDAPGFMPDDIDGKGKPEEGELCNLAGIRYDAVLSSRGAALMHVYPKDAQYTGSDHFDISSTPEQERWRSLRTVFRGGDANTQVKYDRFVWKLEPRENNTSCTFTYEDDDVRIVKSVAAGSRPFEMNVETSVTNRATEAKRHQLTMGLYAYRPDADVKGSLGRVAPLQTELSCAIGNDVKRKKKDDFKSDWFTEPGVDRYAAVTSHYFAQALIPQPTEGAVADRPTCQLLAEDGWYLKDKPRNADNAATVYHAKLAYPPKELAPQATATYREIAFFGPKERDVLAHAAGGGPKLADVTDLGFFTPVARVLLRVLEFIHDHITFGNWGLAIIMMTIGLRSLLFPLTYKSIKTTIAMRRLKPEVDALNVKFADDAQAKNLAMMELWKKHGVNPFGGCLPQLVQMPVWFAMYTTLQTAVEMYHTKFLWFFRPLRARQVLRAAALARSLHDRPAADRSAARAWTRCSRR